MGVTTEYYRYTHECTFGIITNGIGRFLNTKEKDNKFVIAGACDRIIVWNIRSKEQEVVIPIEGNEVTELVFTSVNNTLAVGTKTGLIQIFKLLSGENIVNFNGHTAPVTSLKFDNDGMRLFSGSKDTNLIVWDIVNETGMFRLKGHRRPITQCHFINERNVLISSSQDSLIKFWDLNTHHCFQTLSQHQSEIWDFVMIGDQQLITGTQDSELYIWSLTWSSDEVTSQIEKLDLKNEEISENKSKNLIKDLNIEKLGSIMRIGKGRVVNLALDSSLKLLFCHGKNNLLEIFKISTHKECERKLKKKIKKLRKNNQSENVSECSTTLNLSDIIQHFATFKADHVLKNIDLETVGSNVLRILCCLNNNKIEIYETAIDNIAFKLINQISHCGHRTDVRALGFSHDSTKIATASAECIKIWNRFSLICIQTMFSNYGLSLFFAPGDKYIILGCKDGILQIFDISAGYLCEEIPAHGGSIWSLSIYPDQCGFISGSEDKSVKFWQFELVSNDNRLVLSILHSRTLQLQDDVLSVSITRNSRLLAASLLDSTIKIFFFDSLKLPALCIDVSSDSTLIITGGVDKSIKIWGLDFGDCHRSILAHDLGIQALCFVPKSHLFFSAGKDGLIKQWDADNFQNLLTLKMHQKNVWCLAVNDNGKYIASASLDKTIKLWAKTKELLILEEEQEMEREREAYEQYEKNASHVIIGERNKEIDLPSKHTSNTESAADKLLESLDVFQEKVNEINEYEKKSQMMETKLPFPNPHPLMEAMGVSNPYIFFKKVLNSIKSSDLEETLLILPYSSLRKLLMALAALLRNNLGDERICRIISFIFHIHHRQISNDSLLLSIVEDLKRLSFETITELKDQTGFVLAGLKHLKHEIEEERETKLFMTAFENLKQTKRKRKKKENMLQAAILTI